MENTIRGQLVAKKDGIYTNYVFKNLDNGEYVMCSRLPNWDCEELPLFVEGFVSFEFVKGGDLYYNPKTSSEGIYQYTNVYFKNFIKDCKQEEIIL